MRERSTSSYMKTEVKSPQIKGEQYKSKIQQTSFHLQKQTWSWC